MKPSLLYPLGSIFRLAWVSLVVIAVIVLIKHFVFDILPISGESMYPNFHHRDVVVFNKIGYVMAEPKRGDNVVLRFPGDPENERYIKRIIGMPGEHIVIQDGRIVINNIILSESYLPATLATYPSIDVTLKDDEYYLIGDNRPVSSDSRIWGPARRSDFIGKAFLIIFPTKRFQAVPEPLY